MRNIRHIFLPIMLSLIVLAGCNAILEPGEALVDVTEDPSVTQEPDTTAEADSTEEVGLPPVDLEQPLPPSNTLFRLAPHSIDIGVGFIEEDDTRQDVFVNMSIANQTDQTMRIQRSELTMIGDDGERYEAQPLPDRVQPQLYDYEIQPGGSVLGAALFFLPQDTRPILVEWCPLGTCGNRPLQVEVDVLLPPTS